MIMHINVILTNHVVHELYPIGLFKPYINICGTKLLWLDHLVSIYGNAFKIASSLSLSLLTKIYGKYSRFNKKPMETAAMHAGLNYCLYNISLMQHKHDFTYIWVTFIHQIV